jgi:hypothetical protein
MTSFSNEPFVPLASGPVAKTRREDFRVLMAERPESARPLRALEPVLTGPAANNPRPACEPQVTLHREGSSITGIRVQCSCGQIIDLKCAYPEPGSAPAPA